MSDDQRREFAKNYPDVVAAGGLSGALTRELTALGSTLEAQEPNDIFGQAMFSYARFHAGIRSCEVLLVPMEHMFAVSLEENEVHLAGVPTPDLPTAAAIIRRWLEEGSKLAELAREFDVRLSEHAESYERGTLVEEAWQWILAARFDDHDDFWHFDELGKLIILAAERPQLRRLIPYTSINLFFFVSRGAPPSDALPRISALGNGRYSLWQPSRSG